MQTRPASIRWTIARRPRFPATNPWGIPDLLPHLVPLTLPTATAITDELPGSGAVERRRLWVWRTFAQAERHHGDTLCWYTEDFRFEDLWNRPAKSVETLLRGGWSSIVEPDYSVVAGTGLALSLWQVYRNRWLARWWQEHGLDVIPSLTWGDEDSLEWSLAGIPRYCESVSVECRPGRVDAAAWSRVLARALDWIQPRRVLVYGPPVEWVAEHAPRQWCYHVCPGWRATDRRRGLRTRSGGRVEPEGAAP